MRRRLGQGLPDPQTLPRGWSGQQARGDAIFPVARLGHPNAPP
ncbi:hypothetical protein [Stenotrophomonas sp. P5_B8]